MGDAGHADAGHERADAGADAEPDAADERHAADDDAERYAAGDGAEQHDDADAGSVAAVERRLRTGSGRLDHGANGAHDGQSATSARDDAAGDVPGRLRDAAGYVLHWTADGAH